MATGILAPNPVPFPDSPAAPLAGAALPPPTAAAWAVFAGALAGAVTLGAPSPATAAVAGVEAPAHGLVVFDRVHVIPHELDLGFVLSNLTFSVEVWNAWRARARSLTDVTITGSAGLELVSPPAFPVHVPATSSALWELRALGAGDPTLDNLVSWVFTGEPAGGATLVITGTRLLPWPFPWNAAEPLGEGIAYLTDVHEAWAGMEQRIRLRGAPRGSLEFGVQLLDSRDAQYAAALLHAGQGRVFGIPAWQHAARLEAAVGPGATVLLVDTTGVSWAAGDVAVLWRDPVTMESATVEIVAPGQLTLAGGLAGTWPAGDTRVMPLRSGRLPEEAPFGWDDLRIAGARFRFELERVPAPSGALGSTYLGYDVLDQVGHDRQGRIEESSLRRVDLVDGATGLRRGAPRTTAPAPVRPFVWTCPTRVAGEALRAFLAARQGRLVPFWLLTGQQDLTLSADVLGGATTLPVRWAGYTRHLFPDTGARRHVALYAAGAGAGAQAMHRVTGASDPGSGTESLGLASGVPGPFPAATTVVSFLRLCRLDQDDVEIQWLSPGVCQAVLPVREIPQEAPL